jgi:thymidine phosphorylase
VDYAVGFDTISKTEARVQEGETLFRIHARDEAAFERAIKILEGAVEIAPE